MLRSPSPSRSVGQDECLQHLGDLALVLEVVGVDHLGTQALQAHVPANKMR